MAKKSINTATKRVATDGTKEVLELHVSEDAYVNIWPHDEWQKTDLPPRVKHLLANVEKTIETIHGIQQLLSNDNAHSQDAAMNPEQIRYSGLSPAIQTALYHAQEILLSRTSSDLEAARAA